MADACLFHRCCTAVSSPGTLPSDRRNAEAVLLQLRRSPAAAEACAHVLTQAEVGPAFQAAITLRLSTLFLWRRMSADARLDAMRQMARALLPPCGVTVASWSPVRKQALLAIGLYSKRSLLDGQFMQVECGADLDVQEAICSAVQDESNLGILAASLELHKKVKLHFEHVALPVLLERGAAALHRRALSTCATWAFEQAPPVGWVDACEQVIAILERQHELSLALDLAGHQCAERAAMWEFVLRAISASADAFSTASCAQMLKTSPTAAQSTLLARSAATLMAVDVDGDDGLRAFDALVCTLKSLSSTSLSREVVDVLLEAFFSHTISKANVPDLYDETLGTSARDRASCSDVLQLMAVLIREHPLALGTARASLQIKLDSEPALDSMHVALCFAAELVQVSVAALNLASTVGARLAELSSPLLVTDAMRFFRKACAAATLTAEEATHIFEATITALGTLASEPDVLESGLAVLAELARCEGAFQVFTNCFERVWTNPNAPRGLIEGYCSCLREASQGRHPELITLAAPLRDSVLRELPRWDCQYVSGSGQRLAERRFAALAGLAPLGGGFFEPLIQALHAKLSGRYPENLLASATPLLAAMAKQSEVGCPDARALAEKVCVAVASLSPTLDLQEHALDLCEALLATPNPVVTNALIKLATAPYEGDAKRLYHVLSRAPLTAECIQYLLHHGLVHDDVYIQRLVAHTLTRSPPSDDAAVEALRTIFEVALRENSSALQEQLADLFLACATTSAVVAAATCLLQRVGDHALKNLAMQSFESLCAESGDRRTRFFAFVAEVRALTL